MHLLVIFGIALLVFGPKKLPELGKGIGEGIRGFKAVLTEEEKPATREGVIFSRRFRDGPRAGLANAGRITYLAVRNKTAYPGPARRRALPFLPAIIWLSPLLPAAPDMHEGRLSPSPPNKCSAPSLRFLGNKKD